MRASHCILFVTTSSVVSLQRESTKSNNNKDREAIQSETCTRSLSNNKKSFSKENASHKNVSHCENENAPPLIVTVCWVYHFGLFYKLENLLLFFMDLFSFKPARIFRKYIQDIKHSMNMVFFVAIIEQIVVVSLIKSPLNGNLSLNRE